MSPLELLATWPVANASAAIVWADDAATLGDPDRPYHLASVTKLATAMAALVAHEEGTLALDDAVADGATMADLLAHSAGFAPDAAAPITEPRRRRTYSTSAYDVVADAIAERSGIPFPSYLREAVFGPLGMTASALDGSAGADASSTVADVVSLTAAWRHPILVHETTLQRARTPHLPELGGVLPGFGRQDPNPWGLGPEIRGAKTPHWTGASNSAATYGHFGQSGTLVWIDPVAHCTVVALTDRAFGPWAAEAWPAFADAVLAAGPPSGDD
ncbi:MAG: serine hydrolase domain-containing protein [Actinomycetota bacterium]